ncbi:MAG: hypothetical protein ACM3Q2_00845, partial [Syntrophothermus sp.]
MDFKRSLGFFQKTGVSDTNKEKLIQYINLKLAALGAPVYGSHSDYEFIDMARDLIENHKEKNRL